MEKIETKEEAVMVTAKVPCKCCGEMVAAKPCGASQVEVATCKKQKAQTPWLLSVCYLATWAAFVAYHGAAEVAA